jgi:predicted nuclease of predicted toxin-antitoxin system
MGLRESWRVYDRNARSDFAELAGLLGPPPKVLRLRIGNQPTSVVAGALHRHWAAIAAFHDDPEAGCLEID